MRILIVEDDAPLSSFIKKGLEAEHHAVDAALDGEQGLSMALGIDYDLAVLDLNLPGLDGLTVLKNLRQRKPKLPGIILSARARALLRRSHLPSESVLTVLDLSLDRVERKVQRGGRPIELTVKEFALLEYLMRNAGRRLTRAMIIEHVWNLTFDSATNIVDVYINYLRRKVDDGFQAPLIQTVRGVGYQLTASGRPQ